MYAEGVSLGHFPSPWQRSLHNEPNLRAQPWWSPEDTGYQKSIIYQLEEHWETIRRYITSTLQYRISAYLVMNVCMNDCYPTKGNQIVDDKTYFINEYESNHKELLISIIMV